jgi:VWFA-related protein
MLLFLAFSTLLPAQDGQTLRTQSTVVLVPTLVRKKSGEILYGLNSGDFTVEDDGVAQKVYLDEEAEMQPICMVAAMQVGRRADYELPRMRGLSAMLDPVMQQPGSKIALMTFDSSVQPLESFTSDDAAIARDLTNLRPGDGGAAVLDAVHDAVELLSHAPENCKRVLLLISETRDHGSKSKIDDVIKTIGDSNIVVYALAFSPSRSNVLDTLRGNNNPDLHPEKTEMHAGPDLLAPFVLAEQAMRKNMAEAIAAQSGGEYQMFATRKGFDAQMTNFSNHLHSRYLLSFQPTGPHPGLHKLIVRLNPQVEATVLARTSYWVQEQQ